MPQQSIDNEGNPDCAGHQPVGDSRQVSPQRQAVAVIHVEGRQEQNVREAHRGEVPSDPTTPAVSASAAARTRSAKGKRAENEQMIVLGPPHD